MDVDVDNNGKHTFEMYFGQYNNKNKGKKIFFTIIIIKLWVLRAFFACFIMFFYFSFLLLYFVKLMDI